jgi:hypothetical protein
MSNKQYEAGKINPFEVPYQTDISPSGIDAGTYGDDALAGLGLDKVPQRMAAKPTSINAIWADRKQPRRAIPALVGINWNGNPDDVRELLNNWHLIACKKAGRDVDPMRIIKGTVGDDESPDVDGASPLFAEYVALVQLAKSIYMDGLINPITVIQRNGGYVIESGERRWLAYHLLNLYAPDGDWTKIPAQKVDSSGYVWRQAQENTARRQLNAIGMARQLALLIMDAREGMEGDEYTPYEDVVLPGECDRKFYAQVANGNLHRVPRGMGDRIQAAMGLSKGRVNHYRSLLQLTDDETVNDLLWTMADMEDWGEKTLRDIGSLPIDEVRNVVMSDDWSLQDLQDRSTQVYLSPPEAMEPEREYAPVEPPPPPPEMPPVQHERAVNPPEETPPAKEYVGEWLFRRVKVYKPDDPLHGCDGVVTGIEADKRMRVEFVQGVDWYDIADLQRQPEPEGWLLSGTQVRVKKNGYPATVQYTAPSGMISVIFSNNQTFVYTPDELEVVGDNPTSHSMAVQNPAAEPISEPEPMDTPDDAELELLAIDDFKTQTFLFDLQSLANEQGHEKASQMLGNLTKISTEQLRRLARAGVLADKINEHHQAIHQMIEAIWRVSMIKEIMANTPSVFCHVDFKINLTEIDTDIHTGSVLDAR